MLFSCEPRAGKVLAKVAGKQFSITPLIMSPSNTVEPRREVLAAFLMPGGRAVQSRRWPLSAAKDLLEQ